MEPRGLRLMLALACMSAGCEQSGQLVVQVRSDLTPVLEMSGVGIDIEGQGTPGEWDMFFPAGASSEWAEGVRLAQIELPAGEYRLRIGADDPSGELLVQRPVRVLVDDGVVAVTALLTRDCRGVVCPDADASETACLAGRCVPEGCTEENPGACGDPRCASADECAPSMHTCGRAECTASRTCVVFPESSRCTGGDVCSTRDGCVPVGTLGAPRVRYPWNGWSTGSVHAPAERTEHPLRPRLNLAAVPGATGYEIEADDSCGVDGWSSCTFPSPEVDERVTAVVTNGIATLRTSVTWPVSMTAPVGAFYVWHVRACDDTECGAWSTPRYMNVGRQRTDLNGDGYADIVAGANAAIYVGLGGPGAGTVEPTPLPVDTSGCTETGRDWRVATPGDVDGDGFSDAVFTCRNEPFLIRGGPALVSASFAPARRNVHDLAGGDFDGDGFADVVIGDDEDFRCASTRDNRPAVFHGSPTGLAATPDLILLNAVEGFGRSLGHAGDLDGDGFSDLLAGAPSAPSGSLEQAGRGYIYFGGTGWRTDPATLEVERETPALKASFGFDAGGGSDLDGDGLADPIFGTSRLHAQTCGTGPDPAWSGIALALFGSTTRAPTYIEIAEPSRFGEFGNTVAHLGDLEGDGFPEVGVFVQGDGLYLYSASPFMPQLTPRGMWVYGVTYRDTRELVSLGDFNGDGYGDFAGADPEQAMGVSELFLFLGGPGVPDAPVPSVRYEPAGFGYVGFRMGAAL